MSDLSDVIRILPTMNSGSELLSALEVLPEYDSAICDADAPVRLMALSDLYRVYVPNQMSLEIYSKLYLALMRSLQKKGTKLAIQQQNQNFKAIMQQEYSGIMGGSDSFRACLISRHVRIGEIDFLSCKAKSRSNPDGLQGFLTQSGRKICRQGGREEILNRLLLNGGDGVARFGDGAGQRLVAGIALDGVGAGLQVHLGGDAGQVVKGLLHPAGAVGAHHSLNLYGLHRDSSSFLFL